MPPTYHLKDIEISASSLIRARNCFPDEKSAVEVVASVDGVKKPTFRMVPLYSGGELYLKDFALPIVLDISGGEIEPPFPAMRDHKSHLVIGQVDSIETPNNEQINAYGTLDIERSEHARDIVDRAVSEKKKWQCSIRTHIIKAVDQELVERGKPVTVNGKNFIGPLIVARKWKAREGTICDLGADAENSCEIAASLGENLMDPNFRAWIEGLGMNPDSLEQSVLEALQKAYASLSVEPAAESGEPPKEEDKEKPAAAGSGEPPKEDDKKPATPGQVAASSGFVTQRPNPAHTLGTGRIASRQHDDINNNHVLGAALLRSYGVADRAVAAMGYSDRVVDVVSGSRYRGFGLQDLFDHAIRESGEHYEGSRRTDDFIRTAFTAFGRLRDRAVSASSGFSTINVPGILSDVANKTLLKSYDLASGTILKIARVGSANNFQPTHAFSFDMTGELKPLSDSDELQHVTFTEGEYTNKLETRGAMVTLTRQMIINDSLDAFLRIPEQFGRKAGQTIEKMGWKTFFDNRAKLFSAAHKNVLTQKLGIKSLSAGSKLFLEQTGTSEDDYLLLTPKYIVVAPSNKDLAEMLYAEKAVNETTSANNPSPAKNPHAGKFEPIVSPYFSNTKLGGSDENWMLLADPAQIALLEILFLNGQQSPSIESGETSFNTLGMQWRVVLDVGVAPLDYRAGVYSNGSAA